MESSEIIAKLREFINTDDDQGYWYEAFSMDRYIKDPHKTEHGWVIPGLEGYVTCVDSYGGEGQGDEWYKVFKLRTPMADRYFYLPGYYRSFDGATINDEDMHEVYPKQVVKTEWAAQKESK